MRKNVLLLLGFIALIFTSCSEHELAEEKQQNQVSANSFQQRGSEIEIDTSFVVSESKAAMVSFVKGVKPYYSAGMSYDDFKGALDPVDSLTNITTAGDDLLNEAYYIIVNKVNENDIKGVNIANALQAIIQHDFDQGKTKIEDVDLELGSQWLFGLSTESLQTSLVETVVGCKWYQVGCHLSNLWDWLSTTASGGGATNGQTLASAMTILASAITIILLF